MKDNFLPGPGYIQSSFSGRKTEIIAKRKNGLLHKVAGVSPHADGDQNEIARLYNAAYNSYLKNCDNRAVECAEGDLLGEMIKTLEKVLRMYNHANPITGSNQWEKLNIIPQIIGEVLDKAKGEL